MTFKKSKRNLRINKNLERGQSLVEVAISLPVILLILLGTIDFGMAIYSYLTIRDAAQEGALYGSINPNNNSEIENRARFISPTDIKALHFYPVELSNKDLVKVKITTSGEPCQGIIHGKANTITVDITYNYKMIIPLARIIVGSDNFALNANATNVIIQPVCR